MVGDTVGLAFELVWSVTSLFFVGAGLYVANEGRKRRSRSQEIAGTETTRVRDLGPGTAEVKGTARPIDDETVLESPITIADGLATRVRIKEYQSSGKSSSWKTIHERTDAVPFLVDDGTGAVRVELPPEGTLDVESIRTTVGSGEEPSEPIRRFLERERDVEEADRYDLGPVSLGDRRRYSEGTIEPGEDVYVLGRAREATGWDEPDYAIAEPTAADEFVLSDKSEEQLITERKLSGTLMYAVGGLCATVGVASVTFVWLVL